MRSLADIRRRLTLVCGTVNVNDRNWFGVICDAAADVQPLGGINALTDAGIKPAQRSPVQPSGLVSIMSA